MTRKIEEAQPTWFRLSDESWAEIGEAYRNGATAKELAIRWKVSPSSIYRHAWEGGWTKKRSADADARANAEGIGAEERADQTRPDMEVGLFAPPGPEDAGLGDPAALAEQAMAASVRAMRARLFAEAEKLARLSETYGRMAEKRGGPAVTIETIDLETLCDIVMNKDGRVGERFRVDPDDPGPRDPVLVRYWMHRYAEREAFKEQVRRVRANARKAACRAVGLDPDAPLPGF
ncbi:helix-turn-helix domain-containing protein [Brevundimonas sp.]|uniref:helix-turn-helix domain-containing protein n=1 Tax=Brevundimonas sp. TaxID=1871086 RepID=UPI00391A6B76